ncbi:MAG: hypothetical protein EOO89_26035 [Pedobacter sp.]|nr:MAG: hypothetical protein EOO89_26035 [Pedobacter sp.]
MTYKVDQEELQYDYTWERDNGDGEYIGPLDRDKVDKDEGYEVVHFIERLMDKHGLKSLSSQKRIENALQSENLSSVQSREKLITAVEKILGY